MKLEDEALLVEYFVDKVKKNQRSIILTEVETSYGRPDIIQIFINYDILKKRRTSMYLSKFSNEMSFAMTYLYSKGWVKLKTLQQFLGIYDSKFQRLIDILLERKLVDIRKNIYIKSKPCKELLAINRIIAYEAKLFKWKEAIEQAERHFWFTKESYIIIPKKSDRTNILIEEKCQKNNIGLVYFNDNGKFNTKIRCMKKGIINSPFIWKLNEFLVQEDKYE